VADLTVLLVRRGGVIQHIPSIQQRLDGLVRQVEQRGRVGRVLKRVGDDHRHMLPDMLDCQVR
jgi:hypothetical protein